MVNEKKYDSDISKSGFLVLAIVIVVAMIVFGIIASKPATVGDDLNPVPDTPAEYKAPFPEDANEPYIPWQQRQ
ncbi:MAG TPA: hypothetical protein ENI66_00940 [Candidatus Yonathbacteria bacterium]|nr:hypothetical protein [Candidatus Yonathbacteria bacterium]